MLNSDSQHLPKLSRFAYFNNKKPQTSVILEIQNYIFIEGRDLLPKRNSLSNLLSLSLIVFYLILNSN